MGIPAWVWFVVAVVALVAGTTLLVGDRAQRTAKNRERRRWAALRGWQFAEIDQVLPTRWQRGLFAQYSSGVAVDIVAGATFTADGRRQVSVFDLDVGGRVVAVLIGMRCRRPNETTIELWLPEVPVPQESGLDLLGPVGSRYAFVTDVAGARRLVTPDMVDRVDRFTDDVTVVWLENDWVLAALEPPAEPARLESTLRSLGELADLVDPFEVDPNSDHTPGQDRFAPDELAGDQDREHADDLDGAGADGPVEPSYAGNGHADPGDAVSGDAEESRVPGGADSPDEDVSERSGGSRSGDR